MRLILIAVIAALSAFGQAGSHRHRDVRDVHTPEPGTGLLMIAAAVTGAAVLGIRAGRKK